MDVDIEFSDEHTRHEESDIPSLVGEGVDDDYRLSGNSNTSSCSRQPEYGEENHHRAAVFEGDGPELGIVESFHVGIPGPGVRFAVNVLKQCREAVCERRMVYFCWHDNEAERCTDEG
jgi:hypothetical protein